MKNLGHLQNGLCSQEENALLLQRRFTTEDPKIRIVNRVGRKRKYLMCFGKKQSQNDKMFKPRPNNYCGGFALNAVLADMGKGNDPIKVYNVIQRYQKDKILSDPKSVIGIQILTNSFGLGSNTYISLPSGVCAAFHEYEKDVAIKVYYTSVFEKSQFGDLIGEERGRLDKQNVAIKKAALSDNDVQKYALVLVKGTHWIAVKKESENSFFCYDPADGEQIEGDSMLKAITNKGYKANDVNGLYITIP